MKTEEITGQLADAYVQGLSDATDSGQWWLRNKFRRVESWIQILRAVFHLPESPNWKDAHYDNVIESLVIEAFGEEALDPAHRIIKTNPDIIRAWKRLNDN